MVNPGILANPWVRKILEKALKPAATWLAKQLGADWVMKQLEAATERLTSRRNAIKKAREITGGRFGPTLTEGKLRYVVFRGDQPVDIFPPVAADLAVLMEHYDRSRLQDPAEISTTRFRAAAARRFAELRRKFKSGEEPEPVVSTHSLEGVADGKQPMERVKEAVGRQAFHGMVDRLPELLDDLTTAGAATVAEHNGIPETPGIYLFSEGPNPIYVGNTRNLRQRLRQHTGASSRENQASLAWRLALAEAPARGIGAAGTRKEIEAALDFAPLFAEMRERVAAMNVQFVEIDDPITRTVFEVYAAQTLGTDEHNSFETH